MYIDHINFTTFRKGAHGMDPGMEFKSGYCEY